jgi:hypothetical protein
MNFERDFDAFAAMLDDLWSLKGQALSGGARMIFFRALEDYPLREVEAGIFAHSRDPKRGQFLPMPADVIAQIQGIVANDDRPGPEEAWAVAYRSIDETATVVWTAETAEAFGAARPLVLGGDEIGARMAFKEVYSRLVATARGQRIPSTYTATLGTDMEARNAVLLPHAQAGRVPADLLLDAPTFKGIDGLLALPPPTPDKAIENEAVRKAVHERTVAAREKALARLAEMRKEDAAKKAPSVDEQARAHTAALKSETASKVASYAAGNNAAVLRH